MLVACGVALAGVALGACEPPAPPKVVVYGDSLIAESETLIRFLGANDYDVSVRAQGGAALCDFHDLIVDETRRDRPDVVVVSFSGNIETPCMDGVTTFDEVEQRYAEDASALIADIEGVGAQIALMVPPPALQPLALPSALEGAYAGADSIGSRLTADADPTVPRLVGALPAGFETRVSSVDPAYRQRRRRMARSGHGGGRPRRLHAVGRPRRGVDQGAGLRAMGGHCAGVPRRPGRRAGAGPDPLLPAARAPPVRCTRRALPLCRGRRRLPRWRRAGSVRFRRRCPGGLAHARGVGLGDRPRRGAGPHRRARLRRRSLRGDGHRRPFPTRRGRRPSRVRPGPRLRGRRPGLGRQPRGLRLRDRRLRTGRALQPGHRLPACRGRHRRPVRQPRDRPGGARRGRRPGVGHRPRRAHRAGARAKSWWTARWPRCSPPTATVPTSPLPIRARETGTASPGGWRPSPASVRCAWSCSTATGRPRRAPRCWAAPPSRSRCRRPRPRRPRRPRPPPRRPRRPRTPRRRSVPHGAEEFTVSRGEPRTNGGRPMRRIPALIDLVGSVSASDSQTEDDQPGGSDGVAHGRNISAINGSSVIVGPLRRRVRSLPVMVIGSNWSCLCWRARSVCAGEHAGRRPL